MAVFTVSIRKHLTTNNLFAWSNVYHVEADTIRGAIPLVGTLVDVETQIHAPAVTLHSYRISDEAGPLAPIIRSLNIPGTLETGGDSLPVFLATRVDFTADEGRPGRKFYHLMFGEAQQVNGNLVDGLRASLQGIFDTAMPDFSAWLTSPTGTFFYTEASVQLAITQHQFKRKWARRGVPA
jgi:hypothetical protein